MDPCQDHELQGWDVFSEQGYLDVYTSFSDSSEDQRNLEQGSVEMKNEEPAGAPAGLSPLNMCSPELRQQTHYKQDLYGTVMLKPSKTPSNHYYNPCLSVKSF